MEHQLLHQTQHRPQDDTCFEGNDYIGNECPLHANPDISTRDEFSEFHGSNDDHAEEGHTEPVQPDWDTIALYAPSDQDVPLFQEAKNRRREAEQRLEAAVEVAFLDFKRYTDDILACAVNLFHTNKDKLDSAEMEIQQLFESNTDTRLNMERKLEETMTASYAEIQRVMMKVTATNRTSMGST